MNLYANFYGYQIIIATRSISKADPIIKVTNPQLIRVEKLDITSESADKILDNYVMRKSLYIITIYLSANQKLR